MPRKALAPYTQDITYTLHTSRGFDIHSLFRRLIFFVFLVLLASAAWALDTEVPVVWEMYSAHPDAEVSLVILPDGSGPESTQAMTYQGETVDATISLWLVGASTCVTPVANFPFEDMWLEPTGEKWRACYGPSCMDLIPADDSATAEGYAEFQRGFSGGGWSLGPLTFFLNGWAADDYCRDGTLFPPFAMRFNSPDINADLQVNLIDVVLFSQDFYGAYHYRSDFVWDGEIDLLDLAVMAQSQGVSNPHAD